MTPKHAHKFERLSDEAIFCACGEIRTTAEVACDRQHYPVYWPVPYTVPYTPPTYYKWWPTSGTTTVTSGPLLIGSTVADDFSGQTTYTVQP